MMEVFSVYKRLEITATEGHSTCWQTREFPFFASADNSRDYSLPT